MRLNNIKSMMCRNLAASKLQVKLENVSTIRGSYYHEPLQYRHRVLHAQGRNWD